jgi:outer membrane lipoprotein-sorting protein
MVTFQIGSRSVSITGEGAEDAPFIVTGTGPNSPIAAMAEHQMMNHWLGEGNWVPVRTMTTDKPDGGTLAIMTIRTVDENAEVVQANIYFDVSEAFDVRGDST